MAGSVEFQSYGSIPACEEVTNRGRACGTRFRDFSW